MIKPDGRGIWGLNLQNRPRGSRWRWREGSDLCDKVEWINNSIYYRRKETKSLFLHIKCECFERGLFFSLYKYIHPAYTHIWQVNRHPEKHHLRSILISKGLYLFINWNFYISGSIYNCLIMTCTEETLELLEFQRGRIVGNSENGFVSVKSQKTLGSLFLQLRACLCNSPERERSRPHITQINRGPLTGYFSLLGDVWRIIIAAMHLT